MDLTLALSRVRPLSPATSLALNNQPNVASALTFERFIKVASCVEATAQDLFVQFALFFFFTLAAAAACVSRCVHSVSGEGENYKSFAPWPAIPPKDVGEPTLKKGLSYFKVLCLPRAK